MSDSKTHSSSEPVIVWFRRDLRTSDHEALHAAAQTGKPVIALYIREDDHPNPMGAASDWWLQHSLDQLSKRLTVPLTLRRGKALNVLQDIIEETGADEVHWGRRYQSAEIDIDTEVKSTLKEQGVTVESHKTCLLIEPWEVRTGSDTFYKVFTPYWRKAREVMDVGEPLPVPSLTRYSGNVESLELADYDLLPTNPDWGSKMAKYWTPGQNGAQERLDIFLSDAVGYYSEYRDRPDFDRTSRLSPHLAHGEISPREAFVKTQNNSPSSDKFLAELGWREFSYNVLYHFPDLKTKNYNQKFNDFHWAQTGSDLEAWKHGQTGYPFVDAGMRQLWEMGWQHNRVRMVTASFLIKHVMVDWRRGEEWFWDCLLGGDPASNAQGWQWVAGTGFDAAPFFRIFNPIAQGEKFDPKGDYVRRWCPELSKLPNKYIHKPWEAPDHVLANANVTLGSSYPQPIVDHPTARQRALDAYKESRT